MSKGGCWGLENRQLLCRLYSTRSAAPKLEGGAAPAIAVAGWSYYLFISADIYIFRNITSSHMAINFYYVHLIYLVTISYLTLWQRIKYLNLFYFLFPMFFLNFTMSALLLLCAIATLFLLYIYFFGATKEHPCSRVLRQDFLRKYVISQQPMVVGSWNFVCSFVLQLYKHY